MLCYTIDGFHLSINIIFAREGFMRNTLLLGLTMSMMFGAATVHAEANSNDVSANLAVTGTVSSQASACTVHLSRDSIELYSKISHLPAQSASEIVTNFVHLSVTGGEDCNMAGRIAYKFLGTADNADGTSLENSDTRDGAAKGVGIALYQSGGSMVPINSGMILANTDGGNLGVGLVQLTGQAPVAGTVAGSLTIQIERL